MEYYSILGISPFSDTDTIKKAYKKLALECHPDRGGVHDTFTKIQEAYSVLGDPIKRSEYDNVNLRTNFFSVLKKGIVDMVFDYVNKTDDMYHDICISLEDIYNKVVKKISVDVNIDDTVITEIFEIMCEPTKTTCTITGRGNKVKNKSRGNIIFKFRIQKHTHFTLANNNLLYTHNINLGDALTDTHIHIPYFNNQVLNVPIRSPITPGYVITLHTFGIDKQHDLIVTCNVIFPTKIDPTKYNSIKLLLN